MANNKSANLMQLLQTTRSIRRYVAPYLKQDSYLIVLLCILLLGITIANTAMIWYLGTSVNHLTNSLFDLLTTTLIWLAVIVVVNQLMQFLYLYIFQVVYLRFVARIRKATLLNIMQCSYPIVSHFKKGDMMARITNDIDSLKTFILDAPLGLLSDILVFSIYVFMLFWIDVELAFVALGLSPLFFFVQYVLAPRKGVAARHYFKYNGDLMAFEEQVIGNLRGISSFTAEHRVSNKHDSAFELARKWVLRMRAIDIIYDRIFTVLIYLAGVIIVYWGVLGIESGVLQVGTLVSFVVYLGYLSVPVRGIAQLPIMLQGDLNAAQRVKEILEFKPAIRDENITNVLKVRKGEIHFENVFFQYPPHGDEVFAGITETIKPGECVALVGPSGSGKSTFANLILRFYDPQNGCISIDSTDIRAVTLDSLRSNIAIVWQESFFINDTIRENLRLANADASEDQMIDACKSSFAWDYIEKLDDKLDTMIGTNGVNLSVGQFQRLAIAQAFLRDTPILILDEASSALDSQSEKMVVDAIAKLRKDRTTLIIAHRYSSIRAADRVIYFNGDGSITSGTHDQLLQSHPGYQQAVEWQTGSES